VRSRLAAAAVALLALLAVPACSTARASSAHTSTGDARQCPGDVLRVTVSVSQWTDAVRSLGGACTTVTTVLDSAVLDPHDHELTTGDIAALAGADLVVLNGAGYDTWAENAARGLSPRPRVVSAAVAAGLAGEHPDPHLWGDPRIVLATSDAVTAELSGLDPGAAGYFTDRAAGWREKLQPYFTEIDRLRQSLSGRSYAATEQVFDRTAAAIGLRNATPARYLSIVTNEGEPGPGDIVAFEDHLRGGGIDVLIFNSQTEGSLPDALRATARGARLPVVEVTESPPDPGGSFASWQLAELHRLADAYGVTA
jgi:zinc/manganese transport system substrate-binding protein